MWLLMVWLTTRSGQLLRLQRHPSFKHTRLRTLMINTRRWWSSRCSFVIHRAEGEQRSRWWMGCPWIQHFSDNRQWSLRHCAHSTADWDPSWFHLYLHICYRCSGSINYEKHVRDRRFVSTRSPVTAVPQNAGSVPFRDVLNHTGECDQ